MIYFLQESWLKLINEMVHKVQKKDAVQVISLPKVTNPQICRKHQTDEAVTQQTSRELFRTSQLHFYDPRPVC